MCLCQMYGKSGVPYPSGKCMVCGEPVDHSRPVVAQKPERVIDKNGRPLGRRKRKAVNDHLAD